MSDVAPPSAAVPKPEHIPDSVIYDFDFFRDPAYLADPHKRVLELVRSAPPVFWTPRNGGHWMFLSHEANFKASRDPETFSSQFVTEEQMKAFVAQLPPGMPRISVAVPINFDPPEHTKYRAPLQKAFSPKTMLALKDSIRTLANELIDKVRRPRALRFHGRHRRAAAGAGFPEALGPAASSARPSIAPSSGLSSRTRNTMPRRA